MVNLSILLIYLGKPMNACESDFAELQTQIDNKEHNAMI